MSTAYEGRKFTPLVLIRIRLHLELKNHEQFPDHIMTKIIVQTNSMDMYFQSLHYLTLEP